MKTKNLVFDAYSLKLDHGSHWIEVDVDIDEQDIHHILNQIGVDTVVSQIPTKLLLEAIGKSDCMDYFDLIERVEPNEDL